MGLGPGTVKGVCACVYACSSFGVMLTVCIHNYCAIMLDQMQNPYIFSLRLKHATKVIIPHITDMPWNIMLNILLAVVTASLNKDN